VGVFDPLATKLGLPDLVAAAFELTKGKRTPAPDRHTGQGIFFTSRLMDRFGLEANEIALVVEAPLNDFAVSSSSVSVGTTVWWEIDAASDREPGELFSRFADDDLYFSRTRVQLAVIAGRSIVSRSEAARVTDGLDRFAEAVVDFSGVEHAGNAFIDEVFRVWATLHPGTRLSAENVDPIVERQIRAASRNAPVDG